MYNGKSIESMNFDELRSFVKVLYADVQEISGLLARTKRQYDDMLYNLSRENLSIELINEQEEYVNSTIKKESEAIGVKLEQYSTIEQTAAKIATSVSETKQYVDNKLGDVEFDEYTTIEQTAESISTLAARQVDIKNATEVTENDQMKDKNKVYKMCYTDDKGFPSEKYYYYSDIANEWIPFQAENLYTVFQQTTDGFELLGNVKIDGSLITQGVIKGISVYASKKYTDQSVALIAGNGSDSYIKIGSVGIIYPDVSNGQVVISAKKQGANLVLTGETIRFDADTVEGLGVVPVFGG